MNLPTRYHAWILWVGDGTGLPDAILHIHAGLAILLLVRVVTGRSLATFIPFGAVVAAELTNELMDYLVYGIRWADTLADVGNTLSLAVRYQLGRSPPSDATARPSAPLTAALARAAVDEALRGSR